MMPAAAYSIETAAGVVGVADGRIRTGARSGLTFAVPDGELRPGLINGHDHLHRNHYPRLGRPPYPDAYAWGLDIHDRDRDTIAAARAVPRTEALRFGAFRNLIAGVTTVLHHDEWEPDFERDFPLHVARVRSVHSLGFDRAGVDRLLAAGGGREGPFAIHVAEGMTSGATTEIDELHRLGLVHEGLLAVHATACDVARARKLAAAGAAIIWCPTSNLFLFGRTCACDVLAVTDVLLGTDSLLTGDGTLLDELQAARRLGCLGDARLEAAVGALAAQRLGLHRWGVRDGAPADLLLLRRPLLQATVRDVALVTVDGVPRVADEQFAALFEQAHVPVDTMLIDCVPKLVDRALARTASAVMQAWPDSARIIAPRSQGAVPTAYRA